MKLAVTGHRPDKLGKEYDYEGPYSQYISDQIEFYLDDMKPDLCISGMAIGVDTIFAINSLYKKIPLLAAIPFEGQEKMWPEKSKYIFNKILTHHLTNKVYICEPGYAAWKMQKRNEYMVNNCDYLLAVWDGSKGGTGNCIKYARKCKKKIIIINPKEHLT